MPEERRPSRLAAARRFFGGRQAARRPTLAEQLDTSAVQSLGESTRYLYVGCVLGLLGFWIACLPVMFRIGRCVAQTLEATRDLCQRIAGFDKDRGFWTKIAIFLTTIAIPCQKS